MKYKLLIVVALAQELQVIKEQVKKLSITGLEIDFILSGIWSYNMIFFILEYIQKKWKPNFVMNLWVCGCREKKSEKLLQIVRIQSDSSDREELVPVYLSIWEFVSILSSERIVESSDAMKWENYVDMESYGVSFVSKKLNVPFIILKQPFDRVSKGSKAVDIWELKESLRAINYESIITDILKWIERNNVAVINLGKYKQEFWLSFSEFEQFKKYYNKLQAYKINFDNFYQKNKVLPKKDFLKKLKEI